MPNIRGNLPQVPPQSQKTNDSEQLNEDIMTNMHKLGRCPYCEAEISSAQILIQYETADSSETFAECPECLDVVHPQ